MTHQDETCGACGGELKTGDDLRYGRCSKCREEGRPIKTNAVTSRRNYKILLIYMIPVIYLIIFTIHHNVLNYMAEKTLQSPNGKIVIRSHIVKELTLDLGHGYFTVPVHDDGAWLEDGQIVMITPYHPIYLSGSWQWRFCQWGYIDGYGALNPFFAKLVYSPRQLLRESTAHALNPLNPTPCMVFVVLCIISVIILKIRR